MLQCVLFTGIDSSVFVITSSTCASVMDRGAPGPWLVEQPFQPIHPKSLPPLANGCSCDPQTLRNLAIAESLTAAKDNAGAHCHRLGRFRATRQHRQFLFLLGSDVERFGRASDGHTQVCIGFVGYSTTFRLKTLVALHRREFTDFREFMTNSRNSLFD